MGSSGLEPPTSRLSGARSNLLSYEPAQCRSLNGPLGFSKLPLWDGDDGIRTHDPLLAGQVLSQLSYTPMSLLTHLFIFLNELQSSLKIEQQVFLPTPIRIVLC